MKNLLNLFAVAGAFGSFLLGYVYAATVYTSPAAMSRDWLTKLAIGGFACLVVAFAADQGEGRRLGWLGVGVAVGSYFLFSNVFQS